MIEDRQTKISNHLPTTIEGVLLTLPSTHIGECISLNPQANIQFFNIQTYLDMIVLLVMIFGTIAMVEFAMVGYVFCVLLLH
jgi:hypothetical protein